MDKKKAGILKNIREFVKRHKELERAILFGSVARGETREDSDIDLILVSSEFDGKSALKRPVPFYLDWDMGPVDFLCYTPEEFDELSRQATIVREALREGIEIKT